MTPTEPTEQNGRGHVPPPTQEQSDGATYFTLARVTQKYLLLIGTFIGLMLGVIVLVVAGFFVILKIVNDVDASTSRMCQGFEDVTEKALTPLKPPPDATPQQRESYAFSNAQKRARIKAISGELLDHAGCKVSING